jgi:hypothetical protein
LGRLPWRDRDPVKWLPWALALAVLMLAMTLVGRADRRAAVAEGRVEILAAQRDSAQRQASRDSVALDSVRVTSEARIAVLAQDRRRTREEAVMASEATQELVASLRSTLDLQQAALLDSIESAHATELALKDREIQQADSATTVVRGLLQATEVALASRVVSDLAATAENDALREQVRALNRARTADRQKGATLLGLVVAVVVVTR